MRGKRILDVACGAGYGSKLLTEANPWLEMVGVDYDRRAIDFAKNNYSAPNISHLVGNAATWTDKHGRDLGSFDCIISFDTIEHLLHREIALIDFAENLTEQGMLMLSTPCKRLHNQLNPAWEHHKIEYSYEDLYNLLRRFFATVLHSEDGTLPNQSFWDSVINAGRVRYVSRMNPVVLLGAD